MTAFYSKERLTELLNNAMNTTLTPQEAQLVLDLIKLYDQAAELCQGSDFPFTIVSALEDAETNSTETFQSLLKKCTERTAKPF